jgi:uncharacterized protein (UPF0548 family)
MFSLQKPTQSLIKEALETLRSLPVSRGVPLGTEGGLGKVYVPPGYSLDQTRSEIGRGAAAFACAKTALRRWQQFDLGWVRVANPEVEIRTGELVVVEAHSLGLWSLNLSRILYVIDEPNRFGFGYSTTAMHVERGEERFLLEYDPASESLYYDLLAVSQPAHWLARLGYPYTRSQQRRFAIQSHRRMRRAILESQLYKAF